MTEKLKAKKLYPAVSQEAKDALEEIFGKKFFQPITDRVKTLEDACEITGEDPTDPKFHKGRPKECALRRLETKIKALSSEHPKLSFKNKNQEKWFPVFVWDGTGFRFFVSFYDSTYTYSGAGSGLCLPNAELSKYAGVQFIEDYNIWLDEE
jgi:hypothetical protein